MKRATVRNAVMLVIAAISASLEAPRLTHTPLTAATVELADASQAIGSAVSQVASEVTHSHLGFDTNIYPGDKAMAAWKDGGDYEWVGYYLPAPCHKDTSWSGTRPRLEQTGWGLAVIYVGQQTWGQKLGGASTTASNKSAKKITTKSRRKGRKKHSTGTMTRKSKTPVATSGNGCSATLVTAAQGAVDARDAIARTEREGFAKGSVLFLDVEYMDAIPQRMRDYYRAWTRTLLADGRYRPGIYAHTRNAATIYDDVNDEYTQAGVDADPPFWIAGSSGFSPGRAPTEVGHAFASAWQGVLDVVRTHNGVQLPIDISVASMASPSSAVR